MTRHGLKDASVDEGQIRRWWNDWPTANIAVAIPAGIVVLDFDDASAIAALNARGCTLPATTVTTTSPGRYHYWFRTSSTIPNRVNVIDGLDLRAAGAMVVVPPSDHASGSKYTFCDVLPLADAPIWLAELIQLKESDPSGADLDSLSSVLEGVPQGMRDSMLWRYACRLEAKRLDEIEKHNLIRLAAAQCTPPYPEHKAMRKLEAAKNFASRSFRLSDAGNAERFVEMHGDDVRYCPAVGWLIWDGRRWSRDESGDLVRRALEAAGLIYVQADLAPDAKTAARTYSWARTSESAVKLKATLEVAQATARMFVPPADLDSDALLLNVLNGTIDVRTGTLRRQRRSDLITKCAPVEYDASARAPRWEAFLHTIMGGNRSLIDFLQRAVGYTLTGDVSEHVLFLLYGTGANGKSTFLETIRTMLGEYAMQADFSTFTTGRNHSGGPRNDVARLKGARFVSGVEMEAGAYLSEATVKQMTGGDTVTARFLYKEHFEFKPVFKLFLAANHKPQVRQTDEGIWRRIRLVPFTVTIPPAQRDKQLTTKLAQELPGILNWALEGAAQWLEGGLKPPAEVDDATSEYRQENDPLRDFIETKCLLGEGRTALFSALYGTYKQYCDSSHEVPLTKKQFGESLSERGLLADRGSQGSRIRRGIALRTPEDDFFGS